LSPFDIKVQTFYKPIDPLDTRRYYVEKFSKDGYGQTWVHYRTHLVSGEIVAGQITTVSFANNVEEMKSHQEPESEMWDFIHI
jgi:hypothetical protein